MNSKEICCICLDTIPKTYPKTTCGHLIHYKCLWNYNNSLRTNKTIRCPLCRTHILTYPQTRSGNQWKQYYDKITTIINSIAASKDKNKDKLTNTLLMIEAFAYVWKARITIRRQQSLINTIKNKTHQIDFEFLRKNTTKKQYNNICEIVNNIRRL